MPPRKAGSNPNMAVRRRWICCLFIAAWSACGRPQAQPEERMSISEIRFSLPEGMTDNTVYVFASEQKDFLQQENLMVSHDRIPDGVRDLDGLVRNRLDELKAVAPGDLKVSEDVPSKLGAIPARRLDIMASAEAASMRTLDLLAVMKDGTYMQLAYKVRPRDADAVHRLDYIAGTLSRPGQINAPSAAGFTRRQAGAVSLEIPSDLRPPSDYLFLFPAGQGRLEMHIWRPPEPNPPGTLSDLMAKDAAMAARIDSAPV